TAEPSADLFPTLAERPLLYQTKFMDVTAHLEGVRYAAEVGIHSVLSERVSLLLSVLVQIGDDVVQRHPPPLGVVQQKEGGVRERLGVEAEMEMEQPPCPGGLGPRVLRGHQLADLAELHLPLRGLDDASTGKPIANGRELILARQEQLPCLAQ